MTLQENKSFVKKKIIDPLKESLPLIKSSWKTSWPIIIMMSFEFLMSMTDIYVAGKFGQEVKAATGLASQVYSLFIMLGHALTIGAVSVISRLYSGEDQEKYRSAVFTSFLSALLFGIFISILGITFSTKIATLLNAPEEVKDYASALIKIYFFGIIFHMTLINMNGILRSSQQIKMSMGVMVLSSLLNTVLTLGFYYYTNIGFVGVAISTAISIFVAFIIDLFIIFNIIKKTFKYSTKLLKKILSIGWPGGIVSLSWQFGATILYAILGMLPTRSVETMAAFATGLRIESAVFMPAFAFNMANAVIVGNLMGEKKCNDAFKSGIVTGVISMFTTSFLIFILLINANSIASFMEPNPEVAKEIVKYLYICMIAEPFIALNLAMVGALNGAGDTKPNMIYAIINVWVIRIPLTYILGIYLGFHSTGIWWALNIGFFVQVILTTRRFLSKKWQKIDIS